jgi:hypothetical protein
LPSLGEEAPEGGEAWPHITAHVACIHLAFDIVNSMVVVVGNASWQKLRMQSI